jgi:hypothetical protein
MKLVILLTLLASCGKDVHHHHVNRDPKISKICIPADEPYGAVCRMKYQQDETCYVRHTPVNRPIPCRVFYCIQTGRPVCGPY